MTRRRKRPPRPAKFVPSQGPDQVLIRSSLQLYEASTRLGTPQAELPD